MTGHSIPARRAHDALQDKTLALADVESEPEK